MDSKIDVYIGRLLATGANLPFIEWYSHLKQDCFKIVNPYSLYREEKIVLCSINEGFEAALLGAIELMVEKKETYVDSLTSYGL